MSAMDCTDLDELAPELVLDLLDGAQRGAAMAHLETCATCQRLVDTLAADADRLLMLAPRTEPPLGFEQRVLSSVALLAQPAQVAQRAQPAQPAQPARARALRRPGALAALALAACVALVAMVLSLGPSSRPALAAAEMRTSGGDVVGQVFVHREPSAALFMTLPGWFSDIRRYGQPDETYSLRIDRTDQPPRLVPLEIERDSSWATTLDIDPDTITAVAIIDSQGHIWCEAEL
ncbi:MAG: hypothetical protein ACRD07_14225 [Acidimicrobiales bacterium]